MIDLADPPPSVCGRPNPGAGPGGYVEQTLRMYPHFCRCSHQFSHVGRHHCSICKAEWNPPAMDPEHPAVRSQGRGAI